jgi:hypothetical protein
MRTTARTAMALMVTAAAIVAAGCTSIGTDARNPLIPADTARDTVNKADAAAGALQNQVNDYTTP